jgi:hypothetical protein
MSGWPQPERPPPPQPRSDCVHRIIDIILSALNLPLSDGPPAHPPCRPAVHKDMWDSEGEALPPVPMYVLPYTTALLEARGSLSERM